MKANDLSGRATSNYGYDAVYELLSATQGSNTTESYTYDPVGNRLSSRFASTPSRTMFYDGAYAPFGESYAETGSADRSFTGMNQDTVSALYDFPAREYGIQGRWPSPDPAGISAVDPSDPQTWNRYAYVRNSPLAVVDPTGLFECPICLPRSGGGGGLGYDIYFFAPGVCGGGGFIQSPPVQPPGQCFYILLDPCGGGNGSRNPGSKTASTGNQPQTTTCSASARVLQGNPATVGHQGGIPGIKVQAGSAAMAPTEFGLPNGAALAPYGLQISGYFPGTGLSFRGVTDVNGGKPPLGFSNIRQYLEFENPGDIIIELVTGPDLGSDVPAVITVPAGQSCPTAPPFIADPVLPPAGSPTPAVRRVR